MNNKLSSLSNRLKPKTPPVSAIHATDVVPNTSFNIILIDFTNVFRAGILLIHRSLFIIYILHKVSYKVGGCISVRRENLTKGYGV